MPQLVEHFFDQASRVLMRLHEDGSFSIGEVNAKLDGGSAAYRWKFKDGAWSSELEQPFDVEEKDA